MSSQILALHRNFLEGRDDPVSLVERIQEKQPLVQAQTNAFISVDFERARNTAQAAWKRFRQGQPLGPLDGIPVGLKDLFETQGVLTTAGSRILRDYRPQRDAAVVERLRAAGANVDIGKLNLHEFAFGPTSTSSYFGPVRHFDKPDRMAGGSSGGSAVVVGAELLPAALGTDTGGSIRIPAALCGIAGFKPTYDVVSREGVIPLAWTLDHVGPLARSVEDIVLVLEAISHPRTGNIDQMRAKSLIPPRRIFWPQGPHWEALDGDLNRRFEESVEQWIRLQPGMEVVRGPLPDVDRIRAAQLVIIGAEAANYHWRWLKERPWDYQPDVRERLVSRSTYLAVQYIEALRTRTELMQTYHAWFQKGEYDAIILPTVPVYAPELTVHTLEGYDHEPADIRNLLVWFTSLFNLLGLPAVTIPTALNAEGLAVNVQVVGDYGQDLAILALAHRWQRLVEEG
ncbi:MAG: amidase [Sulfobacillus thermosulfidooxidans]|nr:MAG: amidase [Sulfobacillus thermosulfidooxidans]